MSTTPTLQEIADATTIWYKAQRVLRTIVATLISALTIWAALATIAPQILDELAKILPGSWIAWLAGVIAAISAVAGVISRIMAIPKVNAFLTKWLGLGSVPKSSLAPEPVAVIDAPETFAGEVVYVPDVPGLIVEPDSKVG